jgi:hypothetical protein
MPWPRLFSGAALGLQDALGRWLGARKRFIRPGTAPGQAPLLYQGEVIGSIGGLKSPERAALLISGNRRFISSKRLVLPAECRSLHPYGFTSLIALAENKEVKRAYHEPHHQDTGRRKAAAPA